MRLRTLGFVAAIILAACGPRLMTPATPPPATVTARSGNFLLAASPAEARRGATITIALTVTGPIDYEGGCVQTANFWAEDAHGTVVWQEKRPAIACLAIANLHVAAGQSASFRSNWPTSSRLAPGQYSIHGLFLNWLPRGAGLRVRENLPAVTVQITG